MVRLYITWILLYGYFTAAAESFVVEIINFQYEPRDISIKEGDQITWINLDAADHTVTSGSCSDPEDTFDSGLYGYNDSFSYTFDQAGFYPYYCIPHCGMEGTVTVSIVTANPEADQGSLRLGPNPCSDELIVSMVTEENRTVKYILVSPEGTEYYRREKQLSAGNNTFPIDMDAFPPGLYYLKAVLNEKRYLLKKVIVQH